MGVSTRRVNAGIDLSGDHPEICYFEPDTDNTVTAPLKIGNEDVSFLDILDELNELEYDDDTQFSERESRTEELGKQAAETLKRALSTLGLKDLDDQIVGLTITVPVLTRLNVKMIRTVFRELGIGSDRGFLQSYSESFYFYTLYQKKELWNRSVAFFEFDGSRVSFTALTHNDMTRPVTVRCNEGVTITLKGDRSTWDEQFCNMINASLRQNVYSCVFLQGDTFDQHWAAKSTALLLKGGRKVFITDNLYARGACYAAREKTLQRRLSDYLYLGTDLVLTNLGMQMVIQGRETYYPLISAGVNWYEADKDCECILEGDPELTFLVSSMNSPNNSKTVMKLPGLEKIRRPEGTTRLHIHVGYDSPGRCVIVVEDMGFGDLYPSSGQSWKEVLEG
ncbi:MAG: DUF5716 family protein [Eubacteriales bacterium]|jgi:hypothetical protein